METQKIVNLLNGSDNGNSNINVTGGDANTKVAFKNCAPFKKCRTEINEIFVDDAEHINIAMPMYNLIEYSDNYSDT